MPCLPDLSDYTQIYKRTFEEKVGPIEVNRLDDCTAISFFK